MEAGLAPEQSLGADATAADKGSVSLAGTLLQSGTKELCLGQEGPHWSCLWPSLGWFVSKGKVLVHGGGQVCG